MRKILAAALLAGLAASASAQQDPIASAAAELQPVAAFAAIADPRDRAVALFREAGKVLQHPRCLNCHPAGDRPSQTDLMRPHQPLVVRGEDGLGAPGLGCPTCHHAANFDPARVPGDPAWHLAPLEMTWQQRSLGQICEQIKDPARNGNRDMAVILDHMANDHLVGWAWSPGADRTPAPGTQAQFGVLMRAWAAAGGQCPPS